MIERYSLPKMGAVWSEARLLQVWQEIEALALEGWAAEGVVPEGATDQVRAATVDLAAWKAREAQIHHDVAAFVDTLAAAMPEHGRWVHYGLTSSDILDTALGVRLMQSGELLLERLSALFDAVQRLAAEHRDTAMIGRTHGMWAEPTTFGHKVAGFGFELVNSYRRLQAATRTVSYGKISGPVGNHSSVPPGVEQHVVSSLGLNAQPGATQVVSRDRHATFVNTLAVIGAVLERFATEIRHLQRSEVAEVAEPFAERQKGSSAMPHKHNPILSENIPGLARLLRGHAVAAMENVALWHERDISHSSVERVALPDSCLLLDFALARMEKIVSGLTVNPERMRANLEASEGVAFSQNVLLALIAAGMERNDAYRLVQTAAAESVAGGRHLREVLESEPGSMLGEADLDEAFDLATHLRHAGASVDQLVSISVDWLHDPTSS